MKAPGDELAKLSPAEFDVFQKRLKGPQPQKRQVNVELKSLRLRLVSGDSTEDESVFSKKSVVSGKAAQYFYTTKFQSGIRRNLDRVLSHHSSPV